MTRAELLRAAAARLAGAGVDGPERDARVLLRAASGLSPARFSTELRAAPGTGEAERFEAMIAARLRRQPVSQILGEREFWGRSFHVTADVLDPRPESESLIAAALDGPPRRRLLDLGTGSGALLLTLLAEWPGARGLGIDASPAALAVASGNAHRLDLADRADFAEGDWLTGITGRYDCILCNPPYIPEDDLAGLSPEVRDWEPRMALSPGGDGLAPYRRISAELGRVLEPGGVALFEIGYDQGESAPLLFRQAGWSDVRLLQDLGGHPRVILVQG